MLRRHFHFSKVEIHVEDLRCDRFREANLAAFVCP
jgi:hypothetical protein